MVLASNPVLGDSPPAARGPRLRRRLLYLSYEGLLLFGVTFFAGVVAFALTYLGDRMLGRPYAPPQGTILGLWVFGALGIYFTWFWTHGGQTLAMKTWGLRLVDAPGGPVRWPRALFRYLASWWFLLPALALAKGLHLGVRLELAALAIGLIGPSCLARLDPGRQLLQDRIAGTRVRDERPPPSAPPAAPAEVRVDRDASGGDAGGSA